MVNKRRSLSEISENLMSQLDDIPTAQISRSVIEKRGRKKKEPTSPLNLRIDTDLMSAVQELRLHMRQSKEKLDLSQLVNQTLGMSIIEFFGKSKIPPHLLQIFEKQRNL